MFFILFFRLFRRIDKDNNKRQSLKEFSNGIRESGLELSDEECKSLFDSFDKDGNGYLDLDEFIQAMRVSERCYRPINVKLYWPSSLCFL